MHDYDSSFDNTIAEHYKKELHMLDLLEHPYGSKETFWIWTSELLVECFRLAVEENYAGDFMGMIMFKIKDNNMGCKVYHKIVDDNSQYEIYLKRYGIDTRPGDFENYYIELYEKNNRDANAYLIELLSDYIDTVAPYVFDEFKKMVSLYIKDIIDEKEQSETEKRFKQYIAKYKKLKKLFVELQK